MAKSKPPPAHVRTRAELVNEMSEQLKALQFLAEQFGDGRMWAAKLMATIIYVICHDSHGPTVSLLSQLGARDKLRCVSTASEPHPGNLLTVPLMLGFHLGGAGPIQIPRFRMHELSIFKWYPFNQWWEQPVYCRGTEEIITRKQLIFAVRSKDGGGHFDSELDCANYVNMKLGAGWIASVGEVDLPPDPSHLITVWAIGFELFTSIVEHDRQQRLLQESA